MSKILSYVIYSGVAVLLPFGFFFIVSLFQIRWKSSNLKNTSFECGMESLEESRVNLYMHFFFISIVFVIFDLEIVAIMPLVLSEMSDVLWSHLWEVVFFLLFLGLVVEMKTDSLEWKE